MTEVQEQKDLIVLASDQDISSSLMGLFSRIQAFGIRQLENDIFVHPEHDPGCLLRGHDFLRPFVTRYKHALVIFDREGCGQDHLSREILENQLEGRLSGSGWGQRAASIVIDPELEIWVWSSSPHVDSVLGWKNVQPNLRTWLLENGFLNKDEVKPKKPKKAMRGALRVVSKSVSSARFSELAQKVSIANCNDPAFVKLKVTLKQWF